MLKNYFKTALRNVKRNRGFFVLNFAGLYISVVVCILISLIILHETSFDKHDGNINVYRVANNSVASTGKTYDGRTPYPLAGAMRAAMPGEKLISQIHFEKEDVISFGEKKFNEKNIVFADSVFPKLFPLAVKQGGIKRALAEPGFAILTATTAHKYFGNEDAVGKRIKLDNFIDLQVAAVIADAPSNTHLPYNMLVSYPSFKSHLIGDLPINTWSVTAEGFVYIGLSGNNKMKATEKGLSAIADRYTSKNTPGTKTIYQLQPLPDIHFNQLYAASNPSYTINYQYLYLIGAIGLFLVLAACINYTNLSTALAIKKSKEVGVRKTMGATRGHLIQQFLSETFLLSAVVIVAAALSVRFFVPLLNDFLDKNIPLNWLNFKTVLLLIGLWFAVSLLSGLYPALILSGFNPIAALKSKMSAPKTSVIFLRRGLVVFQFLTAQILIIGAIVVAKQMDFVQSQPLGFNKERVLDIALPENKPAELQTLRSELASVPGISSFSLSVGGPITDNNLNTSFNRKEKYSVEQMTATVRPCDLNYLKTYGMKLVAGRWFDENDERETALKMPDSVKHYVFVLNETAIKKLGFASAQDALGKYVTFGINNISAPIVGVVKDYHVASLHESVSPVLMVQYPFFYYNLGIKFSNGYSAANLAAIEKVWNSIYPHDIFESKFLDENVASLYKNEKRTQQLFNLFTFISIAINVLGLIGLLSFIIEQKTKEIGIRKVLGASVKHISFILSKDFLGLIMVAFFIAAPLAWLLMNNWLRDFAYRTDISWWVFGVAVLSTLTITCIAIAFQTVKAAFANPIRSLRME